MKKKILILPCFFLILFYNSYSQTPSWLWAKNIVSTSGDSYDRGLCIATDANDNVFTAGQYVSHNITIGTTTLTNASNTYYHDMFIAKYNSSGNVMWAKSFGSALDEKATAITTDNNGNVFVTGQFNSPSIVIGTTTLSTAGGLDLFIIKFDSNGNIIWAKREGGTSNDNSSAITTDLSGNIFLTGDFGSPTMTIGTNTLTNMGNQDILIAKYTNSGNPLWAKRIGGSSYDITYDINADINGNVLITGTFNSPTMTDGIAVLNNSKNNAMFLMKYNSSGTFQWSDSWSGSSINRGASVKTDSNGNILLLGNFGDTLMTFGGTKTVTCQYVSSAIAKYDAFGNALWAKVCSGGKINAYDMDVDYQGNLLVAGDFICPTIFFASNIIINNGSHDMVLVKYDSFGNEKWGTMCGGNSWDDCSDMAMYSNGDAVILGTYLSNTISFGTNTLTKAATSMMEIYVSRVNTASIISVKEQNKLDNLFVFPNPFSTQATILFDNHQNNAHVFILDELGKEIMNAQFSGKHFIIEKGNMKPGLYFVEIIDDDLKNFHAKIVLE